MIKIFFFLIFLAPSFLFGQTAFSGKPYCLEKTSVNELLVYSNSNSGAFLAQLPFAIPKEASRVSIFNQFGQLVESVNENIFDDSMLLQLVNQVPGTYFIMIEAGGKTSVATVEKS